MDSRPNVVIPFTTEELAPETRALGQKLGARFVHVGGSVTAYWELLEGTLEWRP